MPRRLHELVWRALEWEPHALQREVIFHPSRNIVLAAGRRAGKSQVGGFKLVSEIFRAQAEMQSLHTARRRREYWIVGPEYSDSEKEFRVLWAAANALGFEMDKPGSYNNPITGDMHCSMFGGLFQVHAKSAKYPETLVGEGLSGVILAEAAKLKSSVWYKFLRPTLADFHGWSFSSSTPEGRNWFYEQWQKGQDPERTDWASFRAPSWINPYVYPDGANDVLLQNAIRAKSKDPKNGLYRFLRRVETVDNVPVGIDSEIWAMLLDMSTELFNQEIAALFTEFLGRVFKEFDEEVHVTDQEYKPDWQTVACVDYGFTNPFVWLLLQINPHSERIHILDEYYERHRTTSEAAADIKAAGLAPRSCSAFYPDPAEPDRTRELASLLHIKNASPGSLTINDRVEWIRRKMKICNPHLPWGHPERAPLLTVHRRCTNTIREMNVYKYPKTAEEAEANGKSAPENPEKKDDHTIEALGRFMSGRFGSPWRNSGVRQSNVKVGRGK